MVYYGSLLLKNGFPTFVKGDALAAWNALNLEGSDILSEREMDFLGRYGIGYAGGLCVSH